MPAAGVAAARHGASAAWAAQPELRRQTGRRRRRRLLGQGHVRDGDQVTTINMSTTHSHLHHDPPEPTTRLVELDLYTTSRTARSRARKTPARRPAAARPRRAPSRATLAGPHVEPDAGPARNRSSSASQGVEREPPAMPPAAPWLSGYTIGVTKNSTDNAPDHGHGVGQVRADRNQEQRRHPRRPPRSSRQPATQPAELTPGHAARRRADGHHQGHGHAVAQDDGQQRADRAEPASGTLTCRTRWACSRARVTARTAISWKRQERHEAAEQVETERTHAGARLQVSYQGSTAKTVR